MVGAVADGQPEEELKKTSTKNNWVLPSSQTLIRDRQTP